MSFYLLGRTRRTGDLSLIVPKTYDTREDALEALSALSATQSFAYDGKEVFVADLDDAMPVLLVAPALPPENLQPANVLPSDHEADAGVWEAPFPSELPETPEKIKTSVSYADSDAVLDEIGAEASGESVSIEGTEPAASSSTSLSGSSAEASPDEPAGGLQSAVDVVEPENVPIVDSVSSDVVWPWEKEAERPSSEGVAPDESSASDVGGILEVAPEVTATTVSERDVYVPDPIEEPSVDGDGLLLPVVEPIVEPVDESLVEPVAEPIVEPAAEPIVEPVDESLVEPVVEPIVEPAAEPIVEPTAECLGEPVAAESDSGGLRPSESVLADLEIVTSGSSVYSDEGLPSDSETQLGKLTCDDCVYIGTCPNKEDLDPTSCGNFQWKSI